jgi:hypothetical protein
MVPAKAGSEVNTQCYETANEKHSGPSPNLNNTAKPMTFKSGERLFKIFIVSFEVV